MIPKKVLQYVASGGCKKRAVGLILMTEAEHRALHRNSLNQFKGAIVHNNGLTYLHSGEAYDVNVSVRRYAWRCRAEIFNEPIKVKFD